MDTCATIKGYLQGQLTAAAQYAERANDALLAVVAILTANRGRLCDPNDPAYSPVCCSLYGSKVNDLPSQYKDAERRQQLVQGASDSIAAIDCAAADWQARIGEAAAALSVLRSWTADMMYETTVLLAWMAAQAGQCPVPEVVGD